MVVRLRSALSASRAEAPNQQERLIAAPKAPHPKSFLPKSFLPKLFLHLGVPSPGASYQSDFNPGLFQNAQVGFGGAAVGDDLLQGGRRDD